MALDDSEKKQVALKREAENKAGQCQDLLKQLSNMKEKHEVAVKKVLLLKHVSYHKPILSWKIMPQMGIGSKVTVNKWIYG